MTRPSSAYPYIASRAGLLADRPDAAPEGALYFAEDDLGGTLFRWDGEEWQTVMARGLVDRDDGQAGLVVPYSHHLGFSGGAALVANRTLAARFVPSRDMSIISIGFAVTIAAGGNDAVDVGIVNGAGTTKIASSGPTIGNLNVTGVKNLALTATAELTAGTTYYACLATATSFIGSAPSLASCIPTGLLALTGAGFGGALGVIETLLHTAGGTIPTPLVVSGMPSMPFLWLREA